MKRSTAFGICLLILILSTLAAQDDAVSYPVQKQDFRLFIQDEGDHDFDVLHYGFDWTFDYHASWIQGKARILIESTVPKLERVNLHLADSMMVTGIQQNNQDLVYSHANGQLDISLPEILASGDRIEFAVSYRGSPQTGLYFSQHNNQPIIWSLVEPSLAREWFPCYDHPSDKASADFRITVPPNLVAASNGTLKGTVVNADTTVTYVWEESYPIATYLISVAISNYQILSDQYVTDNHIMDVTHYVYPEHAQAAQTDFAVTVPQIAFFSQAFGEYPFLKEKYGMAEIPGGTAMEHQTCTSYPVRAVTGDNTYDWLIAHELAHQWWGDLVTPEDWADIWLNEGFATYSDALWHEHVYGFPGLKQRMEAFRERYFSHTGQEHPIYDPPLGHLFCATEYQKGAWVLHMLRFVVGDTNFDAILRRYAQDFAYANVDTSDFQNVCEEVYGGSLEWFFSQWIYGSGYPAYQFGWAHSGPNRIKVVVSQLQQDFPLFDMPLELEILLPSGPVRKMIWVSEKEQEFEFSFQEEPQGVVLDPDTWILGRIDSVPLLKQGAGRR